MGLGNGTQDLCYPETQNGQGRGLSSHSMMDGTQVGISPPAGPSCFLLQPRHLAILLPPTLLSHPPLPSSLALAKARNMISE